MTFLSFSHAQTRMLHGQTRYHMASRFLEEIPEGLMKWLTPRFSKKSVFSPAGKSKDVGGFRIGQNVVHAKFGPGVIVDAEGQGGDARMQVNFGNAGVKWLAVSVAKLEAA